MERSRVAFLGHPKRDNCQMRFAWFEVRSVAANPHRSSLSIAIAYSHSSLNQLYVKASTRRILRTCAPNLQKSKDILL
eukprot:2500400-Amphidinium_carterae.2